MPYDWLTSPNVAWQDIGSKEGVRCGKFDIKKTVLAIGCFWLHTRAKRLQLKIKRFLLNGLRKTVGTSCIKSTNEDRRQGQTDYSRWVARTSVLASSKVSRLSNVGRSLGKRLSSRCERQAAGSRLLLIVIWRFWVDKQFIAALKIATKELRQIAQSGGPQHGYWEAIDALEQYISHQSL